MEKKESKTKFYKRFKNQELEELTNELELSPKSSYKNIEKLLRKKLKILLDAEKWQDLQCFPNNNPEKLRGSKIKNQCSLKVNQQYRLIFIWQNNKAWEIEINKHDKSYGK
ncbi:5540_t:CDS:1 [Funneliformis geosporum]|uniref:5540_t:CDS:1 n=1 Tax=Funneliformis geosporum TaxID=1117311 RepID=A0A9W4WHE4_9GLOM|nr:5540_t:CDS:1 [Funneliformis geosporum]